MGSYILTRGNWQYSDTPTKDRHNDTAKATVAPDTQGGTSLPPANPAGSMSAHAEARGPDKTSNALASTGATMEITYTWEPAPGIKEAPQAKDVTITVAGASSYAVSAIADASEQAASATAKATATVAIDGSSATIFNDTETAPRSKTSGNSAALATLKESKFKIAQAVEKIVVSISVEASATRAGESGTASAVAALRDVTVQAT